MSEELLQTVKNALRIKSSAFDNEISDLIDACEKDLIISGIASSRISPDDALIKRAVIIYCKANFGFNDDSEKFNQSYNMLKMHLSLSGDYTTELESGS